MDIWKRRPHHAEYLFQTLPSLPLTRQRIQLHKILHHKIIRPIHPVLIDHLFQKLGDHRLIVLRRTHVSLSQRLTIAELKPETSCLQISQHNGTLEA